MELFMCEVAAGVERVLMWMIKSNKNQDTWMKYIKRDEGGLFPFPVCYFHFSTIFV